jgi:cytochrome c biogenesis protein CcmG/thiol:disulfide interchange protein DsbE
MRLVRLVPLAVLAGLVVAFWTGLGRDPTAVPSPLIGKRAPAFELPSLEHPSVSVRSSDFAGRVWLLNVWGTWCPGCLEEHEVLLELAASRGVTLIGLDWKDDPDAARRWLEERGNPYERVAVDADGRTAIDWGVYGAPETFVVDAFGIVRYKHVGPLTPADVERTILPIVARLRGEAGR